MKKIVSALAAAMVLILASSCSYVFSAYVNGQITGEVSGENGMPIDGAKILIYDSESVRDSDYDMALKASERGTYQDMPNSSTIWGYSSEGIINAIRVVWETSSPAYDKDHDIHDFYVLVLKDGYVPARTYVTVSSGTGAPAAIRIPSLKQIYTSESGISGDVSSSGSPLKGIEVYAYTDADAFNKAADIALGLASLYPEEYADKFTPGNYHGYAVSESDGSYRMKVMWDGETSPGYYLLAVGNGYSPASYVIESGTCTVDEDGKMDISLNKAEKTEETV